jgi:prepilin-type N-terminal cleavage/methylation domain-containing protein
MMDEFWSIFSRQGNTVRLLKPCLQDSKGILGPYHSNMAKAQSLQNHELGDIQENRKAVVINAVNPKFCQTYKLANKQCAERIYRNNSVARGFTLLELMFALAVIGVLSAIAIPAYNEHIEKAKIKTAISEIYAIQVCIERYYTEKFTYPATLEDIAACLPNKGIDPWGKAYVYLNLICKKSQGCLQVG